MPFCCKSSCRSPITINKFKNYYNIIINNNIPYTVDNNYIMICSPVGNQNKFIQKNVKADIVLSGYCTAPDAAISYIIDVDNRVNDPELKNTFNTTTMRSGIVTLLQSLGLMNHNQIFQTELSSNLNPNFNILLTQMLCMISINGTSEAHNVEKVLMNSTDIRKQAEYSLKGWYDRITTILKPGGVILLMGKNAENLLNNSYLEDDNILINLCYKHIKCPSLLCTLIEDYHLFIVPHASLISRFYKNNSKNNSQSIIHKKLKKLNKDLNKIFPKYFQII